MCVVYGVKFTQKPSLVVHARIHNGENHACSVW